MKQNLNYLIQTCVRILTVVLTLTKDVPLFPHSSFNGNIPWTITYILLRTTHTHTHSNQGSQRDFSSPFSCPIHFCYSCLTEALPQCLCKTSDSRTKQTKHLGTVLSPQRFVGNELFTRLVKRTEMIFFCSVCKIQFYEVSPADSVARTLGLSALLGNFIIFIRWSPLTTKTAV